MPAPARRVLPFAIAMGLGGIEHRLDPAAQPIRCRGLYRPERTEHLHYERGIDAGNRNFAQNRVGIRSEGILPLMAMRGVPPTSPLALHKLFGHIAESSARKPLR